MNSNYYYVVGYTAFNDKRYESHKSDDWLNLLIRQAQTKFKHYMEDKTLSSDRKHKIYVMYSGYFDAIESFRKEQDLYYGL